MATCVNNCIIQCQKGHSPNEKRYIFLFFTKVRGHRAPVTSGEARLMCLVMQNFIEIKCVRLSFFLTCSQCDYIHVFGSF